MTLPRLPLMLVCAGAGGGSYILSAPFTPADGPVECPHRDDADAWGLCRVTRVRVVFVSGFPVPSTYDDSPWIAWQHVPNYGPQSADLNADGFVNADDWDAFAIAFEAGCPCADFDGDGFVNGLDYDDFVDMFQGVIEP